MAARNVLAALLCAGGLHGVLFPAAAEAADPITVTGVNGSADPYTFVSEGGSMAGTKLEDDIYLYHPEDPSVKTLTRPGDRLRRRLFHNGERERSYG